MKGRESYVDLFDILTMFLFLGEEGKRRVKGREEEL